MRGTLLPILAQAGITIAGKGIAGMQQPPMPTMEWGAERTRFAHFLREQLIPQREEGIGRLRLETSRAGTAMGGAYLEGVSEIEQRMDEVFGREVSRFEIEQMQAKRGWSQQMEMLRYQRGQERQQLTESIFGTLAAIPTQYGAAQTQAATTEAITSGLAGLGQTQPSTGLLNPMNLLILSQLAMKSGDISQMQALLQQAMKSFSGSSPGTPGGYDAYMTGVMGQ